MTKYGLHIDQVGILEREIMLLLMGIENPDEFTQTLVEEARLDQQTINGITRDVNELIFVPLREQMRSRGEEAKQPVKPTVPPVPSTPPPHRPTEVRQPASIVGWPPSTTVIPANPQLPPRPQQINVSMPRYTAPKPVPPHSVAPTAQKQMDSGRLLEDHEEPHIELGKAPTPTISRPTPPPPNLPGAMPGVQQPSIINKIPLSPTPPQSQLQPKPTIPPTPYSADPYREPIE